MSGDEPHPEQSITLSAARDVIFPTARRAHLRSITLVIACAALLSCSATPRHLDDPVAVMLDRETGWRLRRQASAQAERENPRSTERLAALHQIVSERGFPIWQRRYAAEQLTRYDVDGLREVLPDRLHQIRDSVVYSLFLNVIAEYRWQHAAPAVLREYARPSMSTHEEDRPERCRVAVAVPGSADR